MRSLLTITAILFAASVSAAATFTVQQLPVKHPKQIKVVTQGAISKDTTIELSKKTSCSITQRTEVFYEVACGSDGFVGFDTIVLNSSMSTLPMQVTVGVAASSEKEQILTGGYLYIIILQE